MPKCGRFALLIASATLISACSSTPTVQDDTDQTTFEPQTGSIEPTASPAAEDHSNDKHAIQLAENHPREYIVKKGDTLWDIASMFLRCATDSDEENN